MIVEHCIFVRFVSPQLLLSFLDVVSVKEDLLLVLGTPKLFVQHLRGLIVKLVQLGTYIIRCLFCAQQV